MSEIKICDNLDSSGGTSEPSDYPNLDGPGEEMEHSTSSGYTDHPGLDSVEGDEDFTELFRRG